jgi:Putative prokaryotic signal transducing protein
MVSLTVVATQGEADVICSLLRANGIECSERATDVSAERGGGYGGWREVLVGDSDLSVARELIAAAD